jgi:hypothetical protein
MSPPYLMNDELCNNLDSVSVCASSEDECLKLSTYMIPKNCYLYYCPTSVITVICELY